MRNLFFYIFLFVGFIFYGYAEIEKKLENHIIELAEQKKSEDLQDAIQTLLLTGCIEKVGLDKELRPVFVSIQEIIEKSLAISLKDKSISKFVGAIHTPTPATPFCTTGEIDSFLVTREIFNDPERLKTIQSRIFSLRALLSNGGKIYVIYPIEGWNKRSKEEQEIYLKTCAEYQNQLVDFPVKFPIEDKLIGATYLFKDHEGILYLFSIRSTQANDAKDNINWKIWLGKLSDHKIKKRFLEIEEFLNQIDVIFEKIFR